MSSNDAVLKAALQYASYGWKTVPVFGVNGKQKCRCGKTGCSSAGKHPCAGNGWEKKASDDEEEVGALFDAHPESNIGIMWGQGSGVIDIEFDTEEGRVTADKLLGDCITPTYTSGRSTHRIFKWSERLPVKTVVKHYGLEIRIGGLKACQSVVPPSTHYTGAPYAWLPGLDPESVSPIDVPESLILLLWNDTDGTALTETPARDKSARHKLYETDGKVPEGGRNDTLYKEACALWREQFKFYGRGCFNNPEAQKTVHRRVMGANKLACSPPLNDEEILKICESGRRFLESEAEKQDGAKTYNITSLGLEYTDGEWFPGKWRMEVIDSDPREARLFAPFLPEDGIVMSLVDFDSPQAVHLAVLCATGMVCLDSQPGLWASIWNGSKGNKKEKKPSASGIKAKLIRDAIQVSAPLDAKRLETIADRILDLIQELEPIEEGALPDSRGVPCYHPKDGYYFQFSKLLDPLSKSTDKVERLELSKLLNEVGATDRAVKYCNKVIRFKLLTLESVDTLRKRCNREK